MNTLQIHKTMQEYCVDDAEETISLSDLHVGDDTDVDSEELSKANHSSSSSSSSSFDQDFLGFFSEEWSHNTSYSASPENIFFCGKVVSSKRPMAGDGKTETKSQTSPLFRSNSDSFRYMRKRTASTAPSTSRSKSLPERNRLASSPSKSRWQAFVLGFGFGSGKFPTKMDMGDIKNRQLRRQSTATIPRWVDSWKEESGGRKSENKGWWRVVDVLGCGGGYQRDTMVVV